MSSTTQNRPVPIGLALLLCPLLIAADRSTASRDASDETLRALVNGYAHAIKINDRELALWFVHPLSPQRAGIGAQLQEQLAWYLERARTTALEAFEQVDGDVSAHVDQEFVRVFGIKITRERRRSIFHFREFEGAWRIWKIDEVAGH